MCLGSLVSPVLFVDLIFASTMVALGVAAGYWLKSNPQKGTSHDNEHLQQAIGRLRDLTTSVAQDVDEHNTRVREITTELGSTPSGDPSLEGIVLRSVGDIMAANERLQQQLATAEVKLQRQAQEIETQAAVARTDALTGLHNRRAFDDELHRRHAEWKRRKITFSMLMIDVDNFKKFNDQHGHQAGDAVLRGVAKVLTSTMREMDLMTRYGGEEFAAILPVTNLQEAQRAAERARSAIANGNFVFEGTTFKVTASLGVAQILDSEDGETLVKRADSALYAAKSAGRNCIYIHDGTECRTPVEPYAPTQATKPAAPAARPATAGASAQVGPARSKVVADTPDAAHEASELTIFCTGLRRNVQACRASAQELCLMLVDVDDFRSLIERSGSSQGQKVLETIGDFLTMAVEDPELVSRYGTGQFAVMLPDVDLEAATTIAERVRTAISGSSMQVKGSTMRFTISVGLSHSKETDDTSSLIKRADAALFASKAAGRNCTHVHNGTACELARAAAMAATARI